MKETTDMLAFPAETLDSARSYKLITAIVTPRPIAWVASLNPSGHCNLAPFSSYTFISCDPAKVLISVGPGTEALKDTLANIAARGEFTVSAVTPDLLDLMVQSSARHPPEVSEADLLDIPLHAPAMITTPFVSGTAAALECRLDRIVEVGDADRHRLVIGDVVCFHASAKIWRGDRIDAEAYRPMGRIGGPLYQEQGPILSRPAPKV